MTTTTRIELYLPLIVKVEYGRSIRRTTLVSGSITFDMLDQLIRRLLSLQADDDLVLHYLNNEDNWELLADFFGLAMAVGQGRVLKIKVRLSVNRDEIQEELMAIRARCNNLMARLDESGTSSEAGATVVESTESRADLTNRADPSMATAATHCTPNRVGANVATNVASVSGTQNESIARFQLSATARPFIPRAERACSAPPSLLPLHYNPTPSPLAWSPRPEVMGMVPNVHGVSGRDHHFGWQQPHLNVNRLYRGSMSLVGRSPGSGGPFVPRGLPLNVFRPVVQPQPFVRRQSVQVQPTQQSQLYPVRVSQPSTPQAQTSVEQQRFVPQPMQTINSPRILVPSQQRKQPKPF